MIEKSFIEGIVTEYVADKNIFVTELNINNENIIDVFVDKIDGISINECIGLSKYMQPILDAQELDYELNVSSPGLERPLKVLDQYKKNINRNLSIELNTNAVLEGKLISVSENSIELEIETKIKEGKKNKLVKEISSIEFQAIKSTKILISFK